MDLLYLFVDIRGFIPYNDLGMVKEFIFKYQKELNRMWETEQYIKLPPLA